MPPSFDLKEELITWIYRSGVSYTNPDGWISHGIDLKRRKEAFVVLLTNLKDLGAKRNYFKNGPTRERIVKTSTGEKRFFKRTKTYNHFISKGYAELDQAIIDVFGDGKDCYKDNGQILEETTEIPVESGALSFEDKINAKLNAESDKLDPIESTETEILAIKEFDPTRITGEPEVDANYDPEMDKFLGFNDE